MILLATEGDEVVRPCRVERRLEEIALRCVHLKHDHIPGSGGAVATKSSPPATKTAYKQTVKMQEMASGRALTFLSYGLFENLIWGWLIGTWVGGWVVGGWQKES
jgi:hypothetical protein